MTVENADPLDSGTARIAVIIGTCCYSDEVLQDVRDRSDCTLYSWNPLIDGRIHVNPFRMDACIETLKANGVTHALHAGAVSVDDLSALLNRAEDEDDNVRAENDNYMRYPARFYRSYARRLKEAGIEIISPAHLLPGKYAPVSGMFNHGAILAELLTVADDLKMGTAADCANAMNQQVAPHDPMRIGYIPRSAVYETVQPKDGGTPVFRQIAMESTGSKAMLKSLSAKTAGVRRLLLKVRPSDFPKSLDCPTISPETIDAAHQAGIDLIAIDCEHGLIIDRDATLNAADKAKIILYGF